jgi:hypothetical protein
MTDVHAITTQAIHDALSLRGPEVGGGGFIRTAAPAAYMSDQRLRLARVAAKHLPAGASTLDVERLTDTIEPFIRAILAPSDRSAR